MEWVSYALRTFESGGEENVPYISMWWWKDIVSALKIYLMADGYQVFEAYNGREALEILKKEDIHLVLMDIMMPEMDGITAMLKIREVSNVPVDFAHRQKRGHR